MAISLVFFFKKDFDQYKTVFNGTLMVFNGTLGRDNQ